MNYDLRIKNNTNLDSRLHGNDTRTQKNICGFTLLEILLVVAMMALITSFAPPVFMQLHNKTGFDSNAATYASSLHRAQNLSEAVKNDSSWGVKITNNDVTIFKGASYDSRDINFDEVSTLRSKINISGADEFVFNKMYGTPMLFGTTTFSNETGETKNISVNSTGLILTE